MKTCFELAQSMCALEIEIKKDNEKKIDFNRITVSSLRAD
jgi:hypothetical protein